MQLSSLLLPSSLPALAASLLPYHCHLCYAPSLSSDHSSYHHRFLIAMIFPPGVAISHISHTHCSPDRLPTPPLYLFFHCLHLRLPASPSNARYPSCIVATYSRCSCIFLQPLLCCDQLRKISTLEQRSCKVTKHSTREWA
ncbi:hypothetical protein BHM03_00001599 [Ensete ventricosum]|nr:hypothetical protein BHM03_00001599 [Ensete ventricosum]